MLYVIERRDRPDGARIRRETRAAHLAWLARDYGDRVIMAGPLLSGDGADAAMIGSLLIMDFATAAEAHAFARADPYSRAGLFAETRVTPWRRVLLPPGAPPDASPGG